MALIALLILYSVLLLWLLLAALVAWWRTRWGSWLGWLLGLTLELGLLAVAVATYLTYPGAAIWPILGFVGLMSAPLGLALGLMLTGSLRLEGFARLRDWLLLHPPDPRLMFPRRDPLIPPFKPPAADGEQGLWVPPAPLWLPVAQASSTRWGCWALILLPPALAMILILWLSFGR